LGDVLEEWVHGEIEPTPQDDSQATYCWQKDISKENAEIDWDSMEPEYIERMVRAFIPWPIAWTEWNGKRVKLFDGDLIKFKNDREAGELFIDNDDLLFATKDREICIKVNRLQIEGKTEMDAEEFINGFRDKL
jgi:methionyl-tRNA formyltransferase